MNDGEKTEWEMLNDLWDGLELYINCNDLFVPASDAEELELAEIPEMHKMLVKYGWPGVYAWLSHKINKKPWREQRDWRFYAALKELEGKSDG